VCLQAVCDGVKREVRDGCRRQWRQTFVRCENRGVGGDKKRIRDSEKLVKTCVPAQWTVCTALHLAYSKESVTSAAQFRVQVSADQKEGKKKLIP
jgi:hypothetical protein